LELLSFNLEVHHPSVVDSELSAREVVYLRRLNRKALRAASLARWRDGDSVVQLNLLVLSAHASVYSLRFFFRLGRVLRAGLIQYLRVLDEALHLGVMDIFLHAIQVLLVLRLLLAGASIRVVDMAATSTLLHGG